LRSATAVLASRLGARSCGRNFVRWHADHNRARAVCIGRNPGLSAPERGIPPQFIRRDYEVHHLDGCRDECGADTVRIASESSSSWGARAAADTAGE